MTVHQKLSTLKANENLEETDQPCSIWKNRYKKEVFNDLLKEGWPGWFDFLSHYSKQLYEVWELLSFIPEGTQGEISKPKAQSEEDESESN